MAILGLKKKKDPPEIKSELPSTQLHEYLEVSLSSRGILLKPYDNTASISISSDNVLFPWVGGVIRFTETGGDDEGAKGEFSIIVRGCGGILNGFQNDFLLLITAVDTVSIFDPLNPIYSIKSTLSIPIEPLLARNALEFYSNSLPKAAVGVKVEGTDTEDGDDDGDEEDEDADTESAPEVEADEQAIVLPPASNSLASNSLATTIRLANKPFSWKRLSSFKSPLLSLSNLKSTPIPDVPTPESLPLPVEPPAPIVVEDQDQEIINSKIILDKKVLKECLNEMKGLYFSYSSDITHSLQHKHESSTTEANILKKKKEDKKVSKNEQVEPERKSGLEEPSIHLPLHRRADKRFWWNAYLISSLINAGIDSYVTVLQQGFIEETSVALPLQSSSTFEEPTSINLDLLIISRRSIERPGLRYQRRGIDAAGAVANFVETEFVVRAERDDKFHTGSFVQIRGSIPLYWSQSPWSLKPPPVVDRDREQESLAAMTLHFNSQIKLYGSKIIVVNLGETKGKEAEVVEAYKKGVESLNVSEAIRYVEFDFHRECKGMQYQNIAKLTDTIRNDLEDQGYFWMTEHQVFSSQQGVVRTNCIDNLDRTNVVQSSTSKCMLNRHLVHLGITTQEEGVHDDLDRAFNQLWADNGDRISQLYAGTNALKGDFTRTGKRNVYGLLNDASNSVARILQSTVSDFFKQAVIDYILGINPGAFVEFQNRIDLSDPVELLRLSNIREEAIETCSRLVLLDGEVKVAGWTLLSPQEQDVIRSTNFLEKVLLISNKAVYSITYDFALQKVTSFLRIPTGDIAKIQEGAYILSSIDAGRDPVENYGFIIRFHPEASLERVHTFSMRVKVPKAATTPSPSSSLSNNSISPSTSSGSIEFETKFIAFKAVRKDSIKLSTDGKSQILDSSNNGKGKSARDVVAEIVEVLRLECEKVGAVEVGNKSWIEHKAIISLSEAIAHTSYSDKIQQGIKSLQALIWL